MAIRALTSAPVDSFRADGSLFDLARPEIAEIDFTVLAARLSRIARFNGVPDCGAYSVAQHCVLGTEAMLNEGEDELTAALFLLHDGHEFVIGDQVRPYQILLGCMLADRHGAQMMQAVSLAIADIKAGWDEAIYTTAGLPTPSRWAARQKLAVRGMDERMLAAEALELLGPMAAKWPGLKRGLPRPPFRGTIRPWAPMKAEMAFLDLFSRLRGRAVIETARATHAAHVANLAAPATRKGKAG